MPSTPPLKLRECYVISLRPVGQHGSMRRAASAHGARVLALSPWRIAQRRDAATRTALREALEADVVLFTSPAAARAGSGRANCSKGLDPRHKQSCGLRRVSLTVCGHKAASGRPFF